jgi:hypothetical protein
LKPYRLLRNTHLVLGLLAAVPLLAYAVSAAQMAIPDYRLTPVETRETFDLPAEVEMSPRRVAQWLMDARGLRGDLTAVSTSKGVASLTIVRPGTSHVARYDGQRRSISVATTRLGALGMLNRLHHAAGISHDYGAINLWGWLLLCVSVALLLIAITGVALWFVRHETRRVGAVVLAAGLLWGGVLLLLVRNA